MENLILRKLDRIEKLTLLSAKKVLTLEDVALITGLSKSWIYKATSSKTIPFYKPNGKQLYFDKVEIEDWMKQNRITPTDEIDEMADNYLATKGY